MELAQIVWFHTLEPANVRKKNSNATSFKSTPFSLKLHVYTYLSFYFWSVNSSSLLFCHLYPHSTIQVGKGILSGAFGKFEQTITLEMWKKMESLRCHHLSNFIHICTSWKHWNTHFLSTISSRKGSGMFLCECNNFQSQMSMIYHIFCCTDSNIVTTHLYELSFALLLIGMSLIAKYWILTDGHFLHWTDNVEQCSNRYRFSCALGMPIRNSRVHNANSDSATNPLECLTVPHSA